jgi:ABC-2 type transport system permease protein
MRELTPVVSALLYLRLNSLRNLLWSNLRRLKQPRYLLGLAVAIAYFWLLFFSRPGVQDAKALPKNLLPEGALELLAASAVILLLLFQWMVPGDKPGLRFTEAEVAFLFPAPIARRQLIHYKLIHTLVTSLLGALFFTLLSSGRRAGWDGALRQLLAWWLLTSTMSLHSMGVALTLNKFSGFGGRKLLRRLVLTAVVIGFIVLEGFLMLNGKRELLESLLAPGRLLVRPLLIGVESYWWALAPLPLLLALHYYWVLKMEAPFEEASVVLAAKQAEVVNRLRAGKGLRLSGSERAKRAPFTLQAWMPVELALYWKNLLQAPAYLNRWSLLTMLGLLTAGMQWLSQQTELPLSRLDTAFGGLAGMLLAYLLMFGPLLARVDLRADMTHMDMLRTWPWPGWRLVLGSLLAPIVVLTCIGWVLLVVAVLGLSSGPDNTELALTERLGVGASVALLLPLLFALQLLVPNAMALYFPSWAQGQRANQRGMEMAGLQIVLMLAQFIVLILALLPVLLTAGVVVFLSQWAASPLLTWGFAVLAMLLVLLLEVLYGVYLLGERFEQFDITEAA